MKKARFWIGILISILALALAFRQVDLEGVWAALVGVNYWLLAASLLPLLLFLVLRAFRWRLLFYPQAGLRIANLIAVISIGYLLSNIFPARLGDVARAYLIGDTEEVSRTVAFSTIVAERVLDALSAVGGFFLALLLLSTAQGPSVPLPPWMLRSGLIVGAASLVAIALFVVLVRRRAWTLRLLDRCLRAVRWPDEENVTRFWQRLAGRTPLRFVVREPAQARLPWAGRSRLVEIASSFIDGFTGITSPRLGPPLLLWSALIWGVISLYYWMILLAFEPAQPFAAGLAVTSVTALGMTVPSSPGYIGVFELLTRETLVLFGMAPEPALSYALVAHAIVYLAYILLGLAGMIRQNLSYAEIQRRIAAEAQESP
jgi:uncharacterized membrane protein YbhN (UPF0104 family)